MGDHADRPLLRRRNRAILGHRPEGIRAARPTAPLQSPRGEPPADMEPFPSPAHAVRRDYLFVDVQHGLCNRLRALASAAVIAERTGRALVTLWRPDHHCEARLSDLLDYDGIVLEDATADALRREGDLSYNYMEIEPGSCFQAPILEEAGAAAGRNVFIRSAYPLVSPHRDADAERIFLRGLRPAEPVRELIARVRHPNDVAAHIRMGTGARFDHLSYESPANWPAQRHRELVEWRERSHVDRFTARLDRLVQEGQAETIFLAADLPETYDAVLERYGERVAVLPRDLFDRSAAQVQHALADLLLLTSATRLLASTYSSFSDLARILSNPARPCERSGHDF